MTGPRTPALDETGMMWAGRGVWALCVAIYLIVFVGGIQAGGEELGVVLRAAGFTLLGAFLGRIGLNVLAKASLPGEEVPMDEPERRVGSLVDLMSEPNLGEQDEQADAA